MFCMSDVTLDPVKRIALRSVCALGAKTSNVFLSISCKVYPLLCTCCEVWRRELH